MTKNASSNNRQARLAMLAGVTMLCGMSAGNAAEQAWRFSVSERVRKSIERNAPEPLAGAHFVKL